MLLGLSASKLPMVPQSGSLAKAPPTRTVTYDYEFSSTLSLELQGLQRRLKFTRQQGLAHGI